MSYEKAPDYVEVSERIVEFREKYPDGALQPADPAVPYRIETIGEQTFVVVVAAAYRKPGDTLPGIGMAWERFPGKTPYTKDSELQNCETSAWGRAIVAALAADTKRGIASADEVRARSAAKPARAARPAPDRSAADEAREYLRTAATQHGVPLAKVVADFRNAGLGELKDSTDAVVIRAFADGLAS